MMTVPFPTTTSGFKFILYHRHLLPQGNHLQLY